MSAQKIVSFHIIEQNIITWTYPSITQQLQAHLLKNIGHFCTRKQNIWCYVSDNNENFAIAILSGEYEPEKYKNLCDIFAKVYAKTRNSIDLVKLFLNLFTIGQCSPHQENGWDFSNFKSATNIKGFIKSFDMEIVLIYIAVLLKRRTIFYSPNPELLYTELFTLTKLIPCRKPNDYLYPLVDNLREVKGLSFFVAGTTNEGAIKEENIYDVFVDMRNHEIKISSKSPDLVAMARTQKDLALFLMKLSENSMTEEQVEEALVKQCQRIVNSLKQFTTGKSVALNDLKSKGLSPGLENFYVNLAIAENVMML